MPVKINVGYPPRQPDSPTADPSLLPTWRRVDPGVGERIGSSALVGATFTIPHLWGLEPLDRLAAYVALGQKPPSPWAEEDPPDRGPWVEYEDRVTEGPPPPHRSALLDSTSGVFLPVPRERIEEAIEEPDDEEGLLESVFDLEDEAERLLEVLGPSTRETSLAEAWQQVRDDAENQRFTLERFLALVLKEASRLARSAALPLYFEHVPARKPSDQPMSSWNQHLYGFSTFESASVDDSGESLVVTFPGGYRYRIPAAYLAQWFGGQVSSEAKLRIAEVDAQCINVRTELTDGREIQFSAAHLLRRCEPTYDDFADLSEDEHQRLAPWLRRAEEMRENPDPKADG